MKFEDIVKKVSSFVAAFIVFFIAAGHLDADITADMCVVSAAVDMAKAVSIFDLDADISEHLCVVHVITVTESAAVYSSIVVGHIIGYGYDGHIAAHCGGTVFVAAYSAAVDSYTAAFRIFKIDLCISGHICILAGISACRASAAHIVFNVCSQCRDIGASIDS